MKDYNNFEEFRKDYESYIDKYEYFEFLKFLKDHRDEIKFVEVNFIWYDYMNEEEYEEYKEENSSPSREFRYEDGKLKEPDIEYGLGDCVEDVINYIEMDDYCPGSDCINCRDIENFTIKDGIINFDFLNLD